MSGQVPSRSRRRRRGEHAGGAGFALLELLAVVAIVAILALAAVPGYRAFMLRAHRVEATSALLALAAAQELFYLRASTYTTELTAAAPDGLGLQALSANGHYRLAILGADATTFSATATAVGAQAQDTRCASFGLDATGARTASSSDCWSR